MNNRFFFFVYYSQVIDVKEKCKIWKKPCTAINYAIDLFTATKVEKADP